MKRYLELDVARTITLLLLPFNHIISMLVHFEMSAPDTLSPFVGILRIAPLGAAIFMVCMGININLTKRTRPSDFIKRAWMLFLFGLLLNVFRYLIPGALGYALYRDTDLLVLAVRSSVASDILYFAALSFLFFALAKKCGLSPRMMLGIALLLSMTDALLPKPPIAGTLCGDLLGNLIYFDSFSSFAFLQWIIFPTFGYAFGEVMLAAERAGREKTFWKKALCISALTALALTVFCRIAGIDLGAISGSQYDTYDMETLGAVLILCGAVFSLEIGRLIARASRGHAAEGFFIRFSENITPFYACQWVLTMWITTALYAAGCGESFWLNAWQVAALCLVLTALSVWTAKALRGIKRGKRNKTA